MAASMEHRWGALWWSQKLVGCAFAGVLLVLSTQAGANESEVSEEGSQEPPEAAPLGADEAEETDDESGEARESESAPEPEPEPIEDRERFFDRLRAERGMSLADQSYRGRRHVLHNTWAGPVGGLRVVDAGSGAPGAFRVHLGGSYLSAPTWLEPDGSHHQRDTVLSIGYTPFNALEVWFSTTAWKNSDYSPDRAYFQVMGDSEIGAKVYRNPTPWLYVGGDLGLRIPINTVRGLGPLFQAGTATARLNVSADLRDHPGLELPGILRANVGYRLHNYGRIVETLEGDRYAALQAEGVADLHPLGVEDRNRISRVERNGLRLDRTDLFLLGFGIEAPIELANGDLTLAPIAEWVAAIPVNRQDFGCPPGGPSPGLDGCGGGSAGHRQALVLGVRAAPFLYGFSVYTAAEIGLAGVSPTSSVIYPQAPYRLLFGFSYAHDTLARSGSKD